MLKEASPLAADSTAATDVEFAIQPSRTRRSTGIIRLFGSSMADLARTFSRGGLVVDERDSRGFVRLDVNLKCPQLQDTSLSSNYQSSAQRLGETAGLVIDLKKTKKLAGTVVVVIT